MKTLIILSLMLFATPMADAAVLAYQVPRPPTEVLWFTNTTEFDLDGNSLSDIVVHEGATSCIGNEVSVLCTTGFRVDFGSAIEVFATSEVAQLIHGGMISASMLGVAGNWSSMTSFYFEYHYGTSPDGYNISPIAERFAVPIRLAGAEGFRYVFIDIDLRELSVNFDGSVSEITRPHVVGIGLETDLGRPVATFAIPEPSYFLLLSQGVLVMLVSRRRRGEQGAAGQPLGLSTFLP